MVDKVNVAEKLSLFDEYWSPKIAGRINNFAVKLVKLKGEFDWHHHEEEDEMFFVVKGSLVIQMRDKDVTVNEGEFIIIPHGVEHRPVAENECHVMLLEPEGTLNTGNVRTEHTVESLDEI